MPPVLTSLGVEHGLAYAITGPDGTRAVLNDPADPDFVGYVTPAGGGGVTGLERAGVRENADVLPEADGGVHGIFRYDRLSFTLSGVILPDAPVGGSWLARQAKLMRATNAMGADAILAWAPSEAPAVQVRFRQQQPTRLTGARPKSFLVTGVCEDPLIYSQVGKDFTVSPASALGGGMVSLMSSPLTSSAGIAGQITVTNAGSRDTWPVLTIAGPITNPVVTNVTTGKSVALIYTLLAGETLVLDANPRRRTVRLNGTANRYGALDFASSAWWPLIPGANDLRLGAANYSAGALLTVQYSDAWG